MTKGQKNALIFLGIFGTVTIVYLYIRKKKSETPGAENTGGMMSVINSIIKPSSGSGTSSSAKTTSSSGYPIKSGSSGEMVTLLQQSLLAQGGKLPKYGADGKFGSETQAALKSLYGVTSVPDSAFMDKIINNNPTGGSPQILTAYGNLKQNGWL